MTIIFPYDYNSKFYAQLPLEKTYSDLLKMSK